MLIRWRFPPLIVAYMILMLLLTVDAVAAPPNTDGWSKAEMYVLEELTRLSNSVVILTEKINDQNVIIGQLQVKSTIFGAFGGAGTFVLALVGVIVVRKRNGYKVKINEGDVDGQ